MLILNVLSKFSKVGWFFFNLDFLRGLLNYLPSIAVYVCKADPPYTIKKEENKWQELQDLGRVHQIII